MGREETSQSCCSQGKTKGKSSLKRLSLIQFLERQIMARSSMVCHMGFIHVASKGSDM
jgi:hypothetical protein